MDDADDLHTPYVPIPIFYPSTKAVEYVNADVATVAKPFDANMTLLYDLENPDRLVGVRLEGVFDLPKSNC